MGARVPYSLLEVPLLAAIYYHFVVARLAMPVGVPLAPCSGHVRALVGNYTPPTTVATCNPVLVILQAVGGTTA